MNLSSVRMRIRWRVTTGEARPISEALHSLMVAARAQPGYVNGSLSTTLGDHVMLIYEEEWQTEGDLERQVISPRFDKLTQLIDRASTRPHVAFRLPGGVQGLDYADRLRKHHDASVSNRLE